MKQSRTLDQRWLYWFAFCAVALASLLLVYGHSLQFFFWSDDFYLLDYVGRNSFSEYVHLSFTRPTQRLPLNFGFHFRPVSQYLKFRLARLLFDLNPLPYRLLLIMFQHFLLGILIVKYCQIITGNLTIGFIAGILFIINRIHFTAIYWVVASSMNLVACFVLISVIAYLQSLDQARKGWIYSWISYLGLALALLSDIAAIVFPILAASSVLLRPDSKSFWNRLFDCVRLWPHVLMIAIFLAIRAPLIVYALGGGGNSYYGISNLAKLTSSYLWGFWWHLETFVEPWRMILDRLTRSFSLFQPLFLSVAGVILTIVGAIWLIKITGKANAGHPVWLGLTWFLVSASPAVATGVLTDYLFAMSAIGFAMAIAYLASSAAGRVGRESMTKKRLILGAFLALSMISARRVVFSLEKTTWPVRDMTLAAKILKVARQQLVDSDHKTVCLVNFPDDGLTLAYMDEAFSLFVDPSSSIHQLTTSDLAGGGCPPDAFQFKYSNDEILIYQPNVTNQIQ